MHFNDEGELKAKYTAFMREVEEERLARAVAAARRPTTRTYQPILVWLGDRMILWGWRLRTRYGALES